MVLIQWLWKRNRLERRTFEDLRIMIPEDTLKLTHPPSLYTTQHGRIGAPQLLS
jgi:hypothetical protein